MNICEKCKKEFKYKYLLDKHLNRKIPCVTNNLMIDRYTKEIEDINNKLNEYIISSYESKTTCYFCNKLFSKRGNLERHLNLTCNTKKQYVTRKDLLINKKLKIENEINKHENIIIKDDHINKLENEIDMIKKTVNTLLKKQSIKKFTTENNGVTFQQIINNVNNVDTINNLNINNNLMININSFGKENISHITEKEYKQYMTGFFPGFVKFIEKVHFDDNAPENHNIYFTNLKSKYIYVYEDNKWIMKQKNDIIDDIIRKKYLLLDDKCEEYEDKEINENISNKFREFQENFYNEEAQKNTKDDVMLLLYNNRDKIEKLRKINTNMIQ